MGAPRSNTAAIQGGERKQITAVFLDLVGFSDVAVRADAEDLQTWLDAFYDQTRAIITSYGGEVTEYLGDGIVAIFGLEHADELAASKAVQAGLTALNDIQTLRVNDIGLELRGGIATGEVAVRETVTGNQPRATGMVTTLAQRIQTRAKPGELLIAENTYQLLRGAISSEPVPDQMLKGFQTAQTLYRPYRTHPRAIPEPPAHFVGRQSQLAIIAETRRPVLIVGQAGLGKSALVSQSLRGIDDVITIAGDGTRVLSSYQPFAHWVVQQTGTRVPDYADLQNTFQNLDETTLKTLAVVVGVKEGQALQSSYSGTALRAMIEAGLWKAIQSRQTSGTLVFEDLHWFDNASLSVVKFIVNSHVAAKYQVLMTSRPDTKLDAYLAGSPAKRIELRPMRDSSALELLDHLSDDKSQHAQLVDRAGGVPLYLEQLSKWRQSTDRDTGELPSSLMDLLSAQIDATGPAKTMLQRAAVIGQKFDLELLYAIMPDTSTLQDHICVAVSTGVLQQTDRTQFRFSHALLHEAAYQSLLRRKRVALHAEIAEFLTKYHADTVRRSPSVLTHHLNLSEQYIPAIENFLSVSQWSLFQGALVDADAHIREAISLCQKVPAKIDARALEISCQATRGSILMQTQGFNSDPVKEVFARISKLAARQNAFSAANGPAFYISATRALATGDTNRAAWFGDMLRDTATELADTPDGYDLRQACLNIDVGYHFYTGDFVQAFAKFEQMRTDYDPSRRLGMLHHYGIDGFASAQMFDVVGRAFCGESHLIPSLSAETDAHQDLLNIPVMRPYALIWGAVPLYYAGHHDEALARLASGIEAATTADLTFWQMTGTAWAFTFNPALSDTPAGLSEFAEIIKAHELSGALLSLPLYRAHLALAQARHGHMHDAFLTAQRALKEVDDTGVMCWQPEVMRILAKICVELNRDETANHLLSGAAKIALKQEAKLWLIRVRLDQHALGQINDDKLAATVLLFDPNATPPEVIEAKARLKNP